jgi:hypothetical protein
VNDHPRQSGADRFNEDALIDAAVARGVRRALERHARDGQAVAIWQDGKVVWVPAAELLANFPPESCGATEPSPSASPTPRNGP